MKEKDNDNNTLIPNYNDLLNNNNYETFVKYFKKPENEAWNYKNEEGFSILHILIYRDLVDLLYEIINIAKQITTPEIYKEFINSKSNKGISVFNFACYKGNMKIIKFLLNNGADYSIKGNNNLSCLHYSAITNKVAPIYYMIKKYNINQYEIDKEGNTFFHWACYCSSLDVINFFLNDDNFNINIPNNQGITPLQYYIMPKPKYLKPIKKLIRRGADPYIKNKYGENSFDIVRQKYNNNDDNDIKKQIYEILIRKNNLNFLFWIFITFHFLFVVFIILFEFPYINIKFLSLIFILYVIWTIVLWNYIFYFLNKESGFIKNNNNNYLLKLIEEDDNNKINLRDYCIKCQIKMEKNSIHCYYCHKCIREFDHHCIWIKKCIGKNNKDDFIILLVLLLFNSSFNFILCFLANKSDISFFFRNLKIFFLKNGHTHFSYLLNFRNIFKILLFFLYFLFWITIHLIILPLIYLRCNYRLKNNYEFPNYKTEYLIESTQEQDDEAINLIE